MSLPAKAVTAIAGLVICAVVSTISLAGKQDGHGAADRNVLGLPPPIPLGFLFVVDSTGDGDNVGSGAVCDDGTGHCTLRAAIEVANANNGDDTIRFDIPTTDPGYTPSVGWWTIKLSRALPDINTNIAIEGLGPSKLLVQRIVSANFRVFNVTTTGTARLSGMQILDGSVLDDNGGGIQNLNSGTLNVTNCMIERCSAFHLIQNGGSIGRSGGGIYNASSGIVNITDSTIAGNTGDDGGGGIYNKAGTITLTNCTVSNNSTNDGAGAGIVNVSGTVSVSNSTVANNSANGESGAGGGIYNGGTLTVANSTFNNNLSGTPGEGGGAINNSFAATLNLTNSTLANNFAIAGGGGIFNGGLATITNCTIAANSVISGSGRGGGLMAGQMTTVTSSIIALNSAASEPDVAMNMPLTSGGFNLIGKTFSGSGFTAPTDHTGTFVAPLDPNLDPAGLRNNGGPTETIALEPGSIAINNGDPAAPPQDQRGFRRVGPADIGAFEFGANYFSHFLGNISTRGMVGIADEVMIGGFVIEGSGNKTVLIRAIGPSLANPPFNLLGVLQDPMLSLFDSGGHMVRDNDNWGDAINASLIPGDLRPVAAQESAIFISLAPGAYTAIVTGANGGTGLALIEVFDRDVTVPVKLSNISTRGLVGTGDQVLIGGFIISGVDNETVVIRAIGPSLAQPPFNLTNVLQNPTLSLFNDQGQRIQFNDDWQTDQKDEIMATGLQPSNAAESAILTTLMPGNYTAIVNGLNGTSGLGLVEVFGRN